MKRGVEKILKDELAKKHACYVLITCGEPSDDGKMHVEMSYEGDATLAAYILQGAQLRLEEEEIKKAPSLNPKKIHHFE